MTGYQNGRPVPIINPDEWYLPAAWQDPTGMIGRMMLERWASRRGRRLGFRGTRTSGSWPSVSREAFVRNIADPGEVIRWRL